MLRLWDMRIEITKHSSLAVYMQIAKKVIQEIQLGRLSPLTAMPGTRDLAKSLGVNRKTVVLAYDELVAQGWLTTEFRRGTFVAANIPTVHKLEDTSSHNISALHNLSTPTELSPVIDRELTTDKLKPFNDGIPDTRLIPYEVLSRTFRHALISSSRANLLGYENPRGALALRKSVSTMLNMERAMHTDINQVCIVRGSQMGIFLAARILTAPGDNVVFEHLTYAPAREAFRSCGANIIDVGLDEHGLQLDELESLCRKHKIKAIYVTPHHQFPTTVMLSAERRLRLLLLAEQYDFVIIEDDYDHEFHFSHRPVFPLCSDDRSGRVLYIGSLSKVLAPGLRVGYIVAPQKFIDRCAAEIMLIDRQGNTVTELATSELIDSGEMKRHIRKAFKIYAERRTLLAELLRCELSLYIDFDMPHGGLAFWLRLKNETKIKTVAKRNLDEQMQIPHALIFNLTSPNTQGIRLGFASCNKNELADNIKRLKQLLAK
jgi:GntR family transcriptional regulator / MocR family aminotransferase